MLLERDEGLIAQERKHWLFPNEGSLGSARGSAGAAADPEATNVSPGLYERHYDELPDHMKYAPSRFADKI